MSCASTSNIGLKFEDRGRFRMWQSHTVRCLNIIRTSNFFYLTALSLNFRSIITIRILYQLSIHCLVIVLISTDNKPLYLKATRNTYIWFGAQAYLIMLTHIYHNYITFANITFSELVLNNVDMNEPYNANISIEN